MLDFLSGSPNDGIAHFPIYYLLFFFLNTEKGSHMLGVQQADELTGNSVQQACTLCVPCY